MELFEKLFNVQQQLKAPKGQYNSFGKYNYRSCEDILEAVKPCLSENKLTLTISDDIINVGDRIYVKATVTLTDIETGKQVSNSAFAREEETKKGMDGSQITGASSSYARKYALNGIFAIDDTKDSDATNTHGKDKDKEEVKEENKDPRCTKTQVQRMRELNVIESNLLRKYNVNSLEDLTFSQANFVIVTKEKALERSK